MKNLKLILVFLGTFFIIAEAGAQSWANYEKFAKDNEKLGPPVRDEKRVIFMGNSITEGWSRFSPGFFEEKSFVNRGISGQTSPQMLARFRQDVIDLKPSVVLILAGTNDIAGNTGYSTIEMIMDNIMSMAELATLHQIKVILCSVLPAYDYPWRKGLEPAGKILRLNSLIKDFAYSKGYIYLDYYSSMSDEKGGMKEELSYDGVHPNEKGYKIMEELALPAIKKALDR
jgi:lysophospholipase L1-like esterase